MEIAATLQLAGIAPWGSSYGHISATKATSGSSPRQGVFGALDSWRVLSEHETRTRVK